MTTKMNYIKKTKRIALWGDKGKKSITCDVADLQHIFNIHKPPKTNEEEPPKKIDSRRRLLCYFLLLSMHSWNKVVVVSELHWNQLPSRKLLTVDRQGSFDFKLDNSHRWGSSKGGEFTANTWQAAVTVSIHFYLFLSLRWRPENVPFPDPHNKYAR